MTFAALNKNNSASSPVNAKETQAKVVDVEVIRAFTPIFIAGIGGLIGAVLLVVVFFRPDVDATKFTAGMGLATTAITGAAGLAQPSRVNGSEKPKTPQEEIEQAQ